MAAQHGKDWDYVPAEKGNGHVIPKGINASVTELDAISKAIQHEIGECQCHPVLNYVGTTTGFHVCPSHAFLREQDRPGGAYRIEKLLWIKRTLSYWKRGEGLVQYCRSCGAPYQTAHNCDDVALNGGKPFEAGARLPW